MAFSPMESAFEGFRLAKRSPLTILIWAAVYLLVTVAFVFLAGNHLPAFIEAMEAIEGTAQPTPEDLQPVFAAYSAMIGPMLPVSIVLGAMLNAAVARAVVRPGESAFGYLRLGMDEVRVFVVTLVIGIIIALACIPAAIVAGIVVGIVAATLADNVGLAIGVGMLAYVAFIAFIIWLSVRFSLAVPITVAERRFAIFDSWRMTKGHVWGLIGMTILAFVLCLVVQILASIIIMPIVYFTTDGFQALTQIEGMTPMEIARTMAPLAIAIGAFASILSSLQLAIMYAPYASAYADMAGRGGTTDS